MGNGIMKKINLEKKGFTLAEVIITIAIIGIIFIIALPKIGSLQTSNKNTKYEAYRKSLLAAVKLYVEDEEKNLFGNNNSGCLIVKYEDLKEKGLAKDFSDPNTSVVEDKTYFEVRKANEFYHYSMSMLLVRSDDESDILYKYYDDLLEGNSCKMKEDVTSPKISIDPNGSGWKNKKDIEITISVDDESGLNDNINIKYYWVKNGTNTVVGDTYKYNFHNKKGKRLVKYKIPTKNIPDDSNQYQLIVSPNSDSFDGVMDIFGNALFIDFKSNVFKIDNTAPVCKNAEGSKTNWTNKDLTIKQYCSDGHSGCTSTYFSKKFTLINVIF